MRVQEGIAGYFKYITSLLSLSRIVQSQDVHTQKRTHTEGFLRGDVFFKDGSRLHFRELVTTEPSVQLVSYTYHYMRSDKTLSPPREPDRCAEQQTANRKEPGGGNREQPPGFVSIPIQQSGSDIG